MSPVLRPAAAIVLAGLTAAVAAPHSRAAGRTDAAAGRCLIAGPYPRRAAAVAVARRVRARGLAAQLSARSALRIAYRVELEGFADAGAAARAAGRLRTAGWHDLELRADRPGGPRISLGVFGRLGNALRRGERARLLGFDPAVRSAYRTVQRWYIQAPASASATALAAAAATLPRPAVCAAAHAVR